jgi:hypothetical protein
MLARMFLARKAARILVTIPLLFVLVACGNNSNSPSGATSSQEKNNSGVPSSQALKPIDFNIANMHVHSGIEINCAYGNYYPTANLVLATDRLTYDSSELQQMQTYVVAINSGHPSSIPSTLKYAQGAGTMANNSPNNFRNGTGCYGAMELTNLGKDVIQIQSVNMRLTAVPQKTNSYQYRMIDLCSLIGNSNLPCGPSGAGATPPAVYPFQLKAASKGTTFTSQNAGQAGPNVVLNPNASYVLPVFFYFSSLDKLTYSLTPELVLVSSNNVPQIVALPQLAATLYFADPNQFSCYTLRGDTFVQYKGPDDSNHYCV